ncbi:MAG TPA: polysaccharide biosynthesis C-terminal domain-containing protein [Chitinophagales bacterium]|nr:polysaccharide biosynthesis C-terminal domain-containing protein [Chitinophagales bacterium]
MGIIQRQGLKNTIVTFAGILLGFVSLLYIQPKFLTAEEIGLTRVLFSFSSLVGVFLPLGIGTITVRYFPVFRNQHKQHNGFFGLIVLFMMTGLLLMGGLLYLAKPFFVIQFQQQSKLFLDYYNYVLPFSFIIGFNAVLTLYCNSLFKTTVPTLFNEILVRILSILLFTAYFCKLVSLPFFILLFVGVYGTQTLSLLAYIYMSDNPGLRVNWELLRNSNYQEMLVFGLWMSFVSVASLGIKFIDSIVIAKNFHLEFVGIYTIAAFIPNIIEAPLNSLDKIAGTKIAHAITHKDYDEVRKIYYLSSKYLLLIGGLIFVGIVTNIEFVLQLLPPKFMGGLDVVYIISLGALFSVAGGANSQIIFSSENFWKGGILLMGIALAAFLLNVILIPQFGINGAAMATAISALLYNGSKVVIVYRNFKMQPFGRQTLLVISIIVLCLIANHFIPVFSNVYANIAIRTFLITILYLLAAYAGNLTSELVEFAKSSIRQLL